MSALAWAGKPTRFWFPTPRCAGRRPRWHRWLRTAGLPPAVLHLSPRHLAEVRLCQGTDTAATKANLGAPASLPPRKRKDRNAPERMPALPGSAFYGWRRGGLFDRWKSRWV